MCLAGPSQRALSMASGFWANRMLCQIFVGPACLMNDLVVDFRFFQFEPWIAGGTFQSRE